MMLRGTLENFTLLLGAAACSGIMGYLATQLGPVLVLGVGAVLIGLLIVPNKAALLVGAIFAGIIVMGATQTYLPGSRYLKFLAPLAALALAIHIVPLLLGSKIRYSAMVVALLVFMGFCILSVVLSIGTNNGAALGLRNYVPMCALFLGLAWLQWGDQMINRLPKLFLGLALLQIPFVAHQFLVLVPLRARMGIEGLVPVDIVAGTFGGTILGGGANAALCLFLVTVVACLFSLWRGKQMAARFAFPLMIVLLIPFFLNSSKITILYLPLVFLVVSFADLKRHPARFLVGSALVAAIALGLVASFVLLKPGGQIDSWQELARVTVENQVGDDVGTGVYAEMTRGNVLPFWLHNHQNGDWQNALFGHGPGATRVFSSELALSGSLAEKTYGGRKIGYTAAAALLWEVGVFGFLSIVALFAIAFTEAKRCYAAYRSIDQVRSAICNGLSAAVLVMFVSLFHKDFLVYHIPFQTLLFCVLGYLAAVAALLPDALTETKS